MVREMVGGCCVCSDDQGFIENPLVYCDGDNCTVAVHQACYGILRVPKDSWYCRKCESQERAARVRCELCPAKDGALKSTASGKWCHIVCALYIPEVRFVDTNTMEPIETGYVPSERFHKACFLCEESGNEARSLFGAKMNCNHRPNCKMYFHVTCGQRAGLLCEEAGNFDHVKYTGYCTNHLSKNRKEGVKQIPPYRPIRTSNAEDSTPESSPRKMFSPEHDAHSAISLPQEQRLNSSRSGDTSLSHLECVSTSSGRTGTLAASKDYSGASSSGGTTNDHHISDKPDKEKKKKKSPPTHSSPEAHSSSNHKDLVETVKKNETKSKSTDHTSSKRSLKNGTVESTSKSSKKAKPDVAPTPTTAKRKKKSRSQESAETVEEEELAVVPEKQGRQRDEKIPTKITRRSSVDNPAADKSILLNGVSSKERISTSEPTSTAANSAPPPTTNGTVNPALTLEQLLERQWSHGSQFIIDQAAHFDIASLLSCLQHFRTENQKLEDRIRTLTMRRDQLLATNARLSLPGQSLYPINGMSSNSGPVTPTNGIVTNGMNGLSPGVNGINGSLPIGMMLPTSSASTNLLSSTLNRNSFPLTTGQGLGVYPSMGPSISAMNLSAAMSSPSPSSESISLATLRNAMAAQQQNLRPNSRSRSETTLGVGSGRSTPSSASSNSSAAFFSNALSSFASTIPTGSHPHLSSFGPFGAALPQGVLSGAASSAVTLSAAPTLSSGGPTASGKR